MLQQCPFTTLSHLPLQRTVKNTMEFRMGSFSGSIEHQDLSMIAVLGNCLFSLAFLSSSFFVDSIEMGFIAFRLLVIAAHIITSYVAIHKKCDTRVVLWSTIFVLVNIYKLLQIAYNHKPIR